MISVLLIILKIIGITLLVIIGLILLLFLLVLFVPVRYRFKGSYDEKFLCKGRITWLLHLVSVRVDVEEKVITSIRILGIPLSVFAKKRATAEKEVEDMAETAVKNTETAVETFSLEQSASKDTNTIANFDKQEVLKEETIAEETKTFFEKVSAKVKEIIQKIRNLIEKLKGIIDKVSDTLRNMKEKKETLKRYLAILKSDTAKAAFSLCKRRLFRMLKHIFPKKMRVNVTYGMNDPADTGYILAVYGMLPEFVGKKVRLHADFEQPVFKGDFYLRGGIRAWTLLWQILCVILDKDCQKLYHIVKKEISNERK